MNRTPHTAGHGYELRFRSLFDPSRALAFPCDGKGCVDIDALSDMARLNYLYARAVIGGEFFLPIVAPVELSLDS